MRKQLTFGLVLMLLVSTLLPRYQAQAAEGTTTTQDTTLMSLGYGDVAVYGWYATADLWLPGGLGKKVVEGSYLNLVFSHSPLLLAEFSVLTVDLNGLPVTSIYLTPQNASEATLRLNLPPDRLDDKLNHFRLTFYMRISDRDCVSMDDRLAWATIHRKTSIHYQFDPSTPPSVDSRTDARGILGSFPAGLVETDPDIGNEAYFAIPEYPTAKELNAVFALGLGIGQAIGGTTLTTTVIPVSELSAQAKTKHLIFVGRGDALRMPTELEGALPLPWNDGSFRYPAGGAIPPDYGVIQVVASPWQKGKLVFVLSGGNDEGVLRAGLALASRAYRKLLGGNYALITEHPQPLPEDEGKLDASGRLLVTFAELGYKELMVSGLGSHVMGISFFSTVNPATATEEELTLELLFSYSGLLDATSQLRVELNGIPVKAISLDPISADLSKATVKLPPTALIYGDNSLSFRWGFLTSEQGVGFCRGLYWEKGWAVIHSNSSLYLAPPAALDPAFLDLSSFPYPWVIQGRFRDSVLVLPDSPRAGELGKFADLAMTLGRFTWYDYVDLPTLVSAQVTDEIKKTKHLIIYGPFSHPLITELADKVPLRFDAKGQKILQGGKDVLIQVDDGAGLGVMELLPSPWAKERAILIFTGSSLETLGWASGLPRAGALSGNVRVINQERIIQSLNIGRAKPKLRPPSPPPSRPEPTIVVALVIGVLVLAGVILAGARFFLQHRERGEESQ